MIPLLEPFQYSTFLKRSVCLVPTDTYWKKYWVIAILKSIHKLKGLEPSVHPFFSIQKLQYVDEMSYKLQRGLKEVRYHDIYDTWAKFLREQGVYHPIWNKDDMESLSRT